MGKTQRILLGLCVIIAHTAHTQNPTIFSVDRPNSAPREVVTIHGTDFGNDLTKVRVFFGGTRGQIKSVSNQVIEVRTPTGATFDPIRVTNTTSRRTASAPGQFFLNYQGESGITVAKFSTQTDFQAESGLYDLCLCDFNDDNKVDVATASNNSNLATVFQNVSSPGTINMTGQNITIGAHTLHVRCGDLNGDGRADIVLSEASDGNRIFVLTNNGGFTFSVQTITLTGMKVKQVGIADLDLDGMSDIVVTNTGGNTISILPNTSTSTVSFGAPISLSIPQASSTDALALGDLDGDRFPEIVTSQYQADSENKLYIARNQGSFNFSEIKIIAVDKAVSNIRIADLDADAKPDIAIARLTGSDIAVYRNNSGTDLSFRDPVFFLTETRPVGMDFSDFDGDGKLDVAVGSIAKTVSVLQNTTAGPGAPTFSGVVKIGATYINRNVRNADLDGDGKPDVIFTSVDDFSGAPIPASKISVFRNLSCMVPRLTPGGTLNICNGTPLQLKATSGGGITYQWFKEGNASPLKTGSDDFLDVATAGEYKVTALSSGPPTCSKISNVVSVTFTTPTATLSPTDPDARSNSPVCSDNVLILNVNDVGATEYRWRGPAGFSQSVTATSLERPGFTLAAAGVYIVEMMAGTCVAKTDSTLVESVTVPDFDIMYNGAAKFCSGKSKTLQVTPALSSGFNYQWYEKTAGMITEATIDNYSANAPGEYYAVVTPDKPGCQPRQTTAVNLLAFEPPSASFQAAESGCVGEEIPFTQLTTGQPGAELVYLWTFGNGKNSQETNPSNIYQQPAAFEVTLKASYAGIEDCSSTTTKTIEVFSVLAPEIVSSAESMCDGDIVHLSVASSFAEVHWSTNESETGINVTEAGEYSVTTRDLHGCESHDATIIAQKPVPQLTVSPETQVVAAGQHVQIQATGADEYLWSPGKTLSDSTIANPIASPVVSTTYVVTGSLAMGCEGTATVTLQVSGEMVNILVPVLFSPNGDTSNETLVIQGVENYQDCSLNVFDKRGGRVYGTVGYQNTWDGTFNGAPLPEGVYYYVFGCPNARAVTGTVTIIR